LKAAITLVLILVFPDTSASFQIEADSSDFATGAGLFQKSKKNGKWHPVIFFNKFLSLVEQNYKIHNKEILTIIWVLKEWQHFLEDAPNSMEI